MTLVLCKYCGDYRNEASYCACAYGEKLMELQSAADGFHQQNARLAEEFRKLDGLRDAVESACLRLEAIDAGAAKEIARSLRAASLLPATPVGMAGKALRHLQDYRNGQQFSGLKGAVYIEFEDGTTLMNHGEEWRVQRAGD